MSYGPLPGGSTQTFALDVTNPEEIDKIFLKYGGVSSECLDSSWWELRGVEVHDIQNGVKSTPRYAIMAPPGGFITTFNYVSGGPDEYYLPIPQVLKHSPSTNLNTFHEDFYVAYDTWNGGDYCARIKDNKFFHAPYTASGCDWVNAHQEDYMDYLDWNGNQRRATANTTANTFTIKRPDGSVVTAGSPTLRYKGRDGTSKWEMRFKN